MEEFREVLPGRHIIPIDQGFCCPKVISLEFMEEVADTSGHSPVPQLEPLGADVGKSKVRDALWFWSQRVSLQNLESCPFGLSGKGLLLEMPSGRS